MTNKSFIQIAEKEEVEKLVTSFKRREANVKARMAPVLKGLWDTSRELAIVENIAVFDDLLNRFPNFKEVIAHYKRAAMVSAKIGTPFYSTPVLLCGDPGIGKTYFSSELAKACGLYYDSFSVATMTSGFILNGLAQGWATAEPGRIAMIAANSKQANPIVLVDEIDKSGGDSRHSVMNSFYALLEKHSAAQFKDECLRFPIDVSHFNWICTANNANDLPAPILSRLKVFYIEEADEVAMCDIVRSVYAQIIEKEPIGAHLEPELDEKIVYELAAISSARDVRKKIYDAAVNAVCKGISTLSMSDFDSEVQSKKQRMGFL